MKRVLALLLLLTIAASLVSCQSGDDTTATVAPPTRVAVLFSSLAEAWQDAGGSVAITVGESVERGLVEEGTPLVDGGAGKSIDVERLLALAPDLVIASPDVPAQVKAAETCRAVGIPTLLVRIETFADYCEAIDSFTSITQDREAAEACRRLSDEISALLASPEATAAEGSTVLFIRAGGSLSATKAKRAEDHFAAAMLEDFGCRNIAAEAPLLVDTLSVEAILAADPDHIFFSLMGSEEGARATVEALLSRPEWQTLTAVREGHVTVLTRELFHYKPNSRWGEAYSTLLAALTGDAP